ncbi:MAG: site-specific integrase [Litorimonas sp.]
MKKSRIIIGPEIFAYNPVFINFSWLRVAVDEGRDPSAERATHRNAPLVRDLHERLAASYGSKASRTQADRLQMWEKQILPVLGSKRFDAVRFSDVEALHRSKTEKGHPYAANRLVEVLRHAFNKAVQWQMCAANPAIGIERDPERPRERYLNAQEMARFQDALDHIQNQASANALRLLAFTGARMGEVLKAQWDQFDLSNGIWEKPAATTKQRRLHRAPLNGSALGVLKQMAATSESAFLFPGDGHGGTQTELRRSFQRACAIAGIKDLRIHDLRHSFASILISSGAELAEVGAMLGHTQAQTTLRYAHLHDTRLREVTNRADALFSRSNHAAE